MALVHCLAAMDGGRTAALDDLISAASILERVDIDSAQRERLSVEVLGAALRCALLGGAENGNGSLLGHELSERGLRLGLERAYRARRAWSTTAPSASGWSISPTGRVRAAGHDRAAGHLRCPGCDAIVVAGDLFCEQCGHAPRPGRAARQRAGPDSSSTWCSRRRSAIAAASTGEMKTRSSWRSSDGGVAAVICDGISSASAGNAAARDAAKTAGEVLAAAGPIPSATARRR